MISTVNRILFRRSGTLNMFLRLESMSGSWAPEGSERLAVGQRVALRRRPAVTERWREHTNATACRLDGLARGRREGVGLHPHGPGELAPPQYLHQAVLAYQTSRPQRL